MKPVAVALAALPLALGLAACGGPDADTGRTRVVTSFYPLAYVAERIGGSEVDVDNLTSPGVEPHDVELRPQQVAAVQDADLVVYQQHFQPAVDAAVDQAGRPAETTVDVTDLVAEKPETGGDGHGDPHVWLDPRAMITIAGAVADALSAVDPAHASRFAANAAEVVTDLQELDRQFADGLEKCRTRTVVTSHAAFQYLADRYDLKQVPIAGIDPTNEPSPSQLADIVQLVRTEQLTTVFTEELVSPAVARTIARETGTVTATLDPIEGLSDDTRDETYLTLMRKNLRALTKANSCS